MVEKENLESIKSKQERVKKARLESLAKARESKRLKRNESNINGFSSTVDEDTRDRRKRTPIGRRTKLDAPKRKGFYRRWVVDRGVRIDAIKDAGYTFVLKDKQKVSRYGGSGKDGKGEKLYLMELPEKYREEDLLRKRKENKARVRDIKRKTKANLETGYDSENKSKKKLTDEELRRLADIMKEK